MDPSASDGNDPFLTIHGKGISPGLACGPVVRNTRDLHSDTVRAAILFMERAVPDDLARIQASAGTVSAGGALLSHVGLLAREYGIPSVALAFGSRAAPIAEGRGILRIRGEGTDRADALLEEGDIVLLDGDRGAFQVPGGVDAGMRASIRSLHEQLKQFAEAPSEDRRLDAIRARCSDPTGPEVAFVLEAAFGFRLVPEGEAARRLLAALRSGADSRSALSARIDRLRTRIRGRVSAGANKAMARIRNATRTLDTQCALGALESEERRGRSLLIDLGEDPLEFHSALDDARSAAEARECALRSGILAAIAQATLLGDDPFRERSGSLFRLARSARESGIPEAESRSLRDRLAALTGTSGADGRGPLVVALDETAPGHPELVGGKAAGLLTARPFLPSGSRIPRGFVVTSAAYRIHTTGEVGEQLRRALHEADDAAAARLARAAILASSISSEVARAVSAGLATLEGSRLAVRSSATVEDGAAGSLAGHFDTFLGVRGLDELLHRIRWTWASLWHAWALRSMRSAGISPLDAGQGVIVQAMVATVSAGVLLARDPAREDDSLLVNAAWGLGEAISQGEVPGDLFWIRRSSGELLALELAAGPKQIVLDPERTGTIESPLPPESAGRPCLDSLQLARLAALVRSFDLAGLAFRDLEFGFASDGGLVVFQVRGLLPGSQPATVPAKVMG